MLFRRAALAFCLLLPTLFAYGGQPARSHPPTDTQRLQTHIKSLNELTERRRVTTFFPHGSAVTKGFVDTVTGAVSFERRDMVVVNHVPLVFARVYDSGTGISREFGQGWSASLIKLTGTNGRFISIARDSQGRITQILDDQKRTVSYKYDNKSRLVAVTDLGGHIWQYQYQHDGLLKKVIDPENHIAAKFKYDSQGRVILSEIQGRRHEFVYQKYKTVVTDGNRNKTIFEFNNHGAVTNVTNALGVNTSLSFDSDGRVEMLKRNGKLLRQFSYTPQGVIDQVTLDTGDKLQYHYDKGQLTSISKDKQIVAQQVFDTKGRPTIINMGGKIRQYQYDEAGNILVEEIEGQKTSYAYNHDGQITRMTQGDAVAHFNYDKAGRLLQIIFPDGSAHDYRYNPQGFRTETQRADGSFVEYGYDNVGNYIRSENENESEEILVDDNNQVTGFVVGGQTVFKALYDNNGNPKIITYGNNPVHYQFDALNRLTEVNDNWDHPIRHQYGKSEKDIRQAQDDRTFRYFLAKPEPTINALYTRTIHPPWPGIAWDEALGELVALSPENEAPDVTTRFAHQRRRLYDAMAKNGPSQRNFDKPSNSFFIPMEYQAINCEPSDPWDDMVFCLLHGVLLDNPGTAIAYTPKLITAFAVDDGECYPEYELAIDGSVVDMNMNGSFVHVFTMPGDHTVQVNAVCTCPYQSNKYYKWAAKTIQVEAASPPDDNQSPLCSATGRTLDQIEADYRQMIIGARGFGWFVAADNMEHFLIVPNADIAISTDWLLGFTPVTDAIEVNIGRFEQEALKVAETLKPGQTTFFDNYWDRTLTGTLLSELFYASGTSTITSTGSFRVARDFDGSISISGSISHHWWDPYDWHAGLFAPIPGFGMVEDSEALCLVEAGRASEFNMTSDWQSNY